MGLWEIGRSRQEEEASLSPLLLAEEGHHGDIAGRGRGGGTISYLGDITVTNPGKGGEDMTITTIGGGGRGASFAFSSRRGGRGRRRHYHDNSRGGQKEASLSALQQEEEEEKEPPSPEQLEQEASPSPLLLVE